MLVLKFVFSVHSVFISAVGLGLALLFFWGFAVDDSSAWHVGLVHIDLFLFGLVPFLAAVQLNFSRMWVWQSLALCTVIALFGIVLMLGWWIGGAPTGFRDERMVPLTAMFVCGGVGRGLLDQFDPLYCGHCWEVGHAEETFRRHCSRLAGWVWVVLLSPAVTLSFLQSPSQSPFQSLSQSQLLSPGRVSLSPASGLRSSG